MLLLAPAAWGAFFALAWAFPPAVCGGGFRGWLQVAAAACLTLALAGLLLIRRRGGRVAAGADGSAHGFALEVGILVAFLLSLSLALSWGFVAGIGPCE